LRYAEPEAGQRGKAHRAGQRRVEFSSVQITPPMCALVRTQLRPKDNRAASSVSANERQHVIETLIRFRDRDVIGIAP
jgi:hypothetical protein